MKDRESNEQYTLLLSSIDRCVSKVDLNVERAVYDDPTLNEKVF